MIWLTLRMVVVLLFLFFVVSAFGSMAVSAITEVLEILGSVVG